MHVRGKPSRSGHGLWDSITAVLRGLANALDALDYLVLALLLVALPFVYFARCVGIDGDDRATPLGTTPTIGPIEPQEDSP